MTLRKISKVLALLLAVVMLAAMFAACTNQPAENNGPKLPTEPVVDGPIVVGYAPFSSKFSPFFSETAYDQDVQAMTQVGLLTSDRQGAIIMNGIEGETKSYNGTDYTYYGIANCKITENEDGTVYYDFVLREDVKFSDGEALTVDDVIFSMYVLCDPTYDGNSSLYSLPIKGIEEYRAGMAAKWTLIFDAGRDAAATDNYTADDVAAFWKAFDEAGVEFVKEIVAYCAPYGATNVAQAAELWGYAGLAEDATEKDFFDAIVDAKGYDLSDNGINYESAGSSITGLLTAKLDGSLLAGVKTGESADKIAGIEKTGANTLRVTLTEVNAPAIYQLGLAVTPMHYYGSDELYDYDANKFGFPKGDLSSVRAKTTQPMGAGPYKFVKFENGVVEFEANGYYFEGCPKTKYFQFKETQEADKLNGVVTGTIDLSDPSFDTATVEAIKKENGGELNGNKITVNTVNNLGYGYIGMSANVVNVGGQPGSDASKNLRKALATVLAVYRDVSIDSYYGERASVINYPISDTSWAAPQASDDGYEIAFSKDVNGNPIYTSDMTAEDKYAAALTAALGYFEAAGFTVTDGKLTAAPEGAALEYEVLIPGDGAADHPVFMTCTEAAKALETIGFKLIVTDLTNSSDLWTAIEAEKAAIWAAAWGATVDPDMFQIYHPDGGSNYMYDINDDELTQLILDARKSLNTESRKLMYKECLDIVVDWAVEIPTYQRQNAIIFSTERLDISTILPDITTFYGWMNGCVNMMPKTAA
ncbi:MAG: ABC transporter substrate-binding protein [Clostridia bacterium]|nr:ABC transporter substrate-binding protein [Clostridia bacterium]